jgi:hypothetical protein
MTFVTEYRRYSIHQNSLSGAVWIERGGAVIAIAKSVAAAFVAINEMCGSR